MRFTFHVSARDFYDLDGFDCITYDEPLHKKLVEAGVGEGDVLRLLLEGGTIYCDVVVEEIEYLDGTIWITYL